MILLNLINSKFNLKKFNTCIQGKRDNYIFNRQILYYETYSIKSFYLFIISICHMYLRKS
jgi:hypothetical protein